MVTATGGAPAAAPTAPVVAPAPVAPSVSPGGAKPFTGTHVASREGQQMVSRAAAQGNKIKVVDATRGAATAAQDAKVAAAAAKNAKVLATEGRVIATVAKDAAQVGRVVGAVAKEGGGLADVIPYVAAGAFILSRAETLLKAYDLHKQGRLGDNLEDIAFELAGAHRVEPSPVEVGTDRDGPEDSQWRAGPKEDAQALRRVGVGRQVHIPKVQPPIGAAKPEPAHTAADKESEDQPPLPPWQDYRLPYWWPESTPARPQTEEPGQNPAENGPPPQQTAANTAPGKQSQQNVDGNWVELHPGTKRQGLVPYQAGPVRPPSNETPDADFDWTEFNEGIKGENGEWIVPPRAQREQEWNDRNRVPPREPKKPEPKKATASQVPNWVLEDSNTPRPNIYHAAPATGPGSGGMSPEAPAGAAGGGGGGKPPPKPLSEGWHYGVYNESEEILGFKIRQADGSIRDRYLLPKQFVHLEYGERPANSLPNLRVRELGPEIPIEHHSIKGADPFEPKLADPAAVKPAQPQNIKGGSDGETVILDLASKETVHIDLLDLSRNEPPPGPSSAQVKPVSPQGAKPWWKFW